MDFSTQRIEGRVPIEMAKEIKALSLDLYQKGEAEPMDKALEIVIRAGLESLGGNIIKKLTAIIDEFKGGQDAKYCITKVAGIIVDYNIVNKR